MLILQFPLPDRVPSPDAALPDLMPKRTEWYPQKLFTIQSCSRVSTWFLQPGFQSRVVGGNRHLPDPILASKSGSNKRIATYLLCVLPYPCQTHTGEPDPVEYNSLHHHSIALFDPLIPPEIPPQSHSVNVATATPLHDRISKTIHFSGAYRPDCYPVFSGHCRRRYPVFHPCRCGNPPSPAPVSPPDPAG